MQLPNPQRAELAYKEVLKRDPDDVAASEKLVLVYGRLGEVARAVELQTELVNRATSAANKRDRTIALARVFSLDPAEFDIDESVLPRGAELLARLALAAG